MDAYATGAFLADADPTDTDADDADDADTDDPTQTTPDYTGSNCGDSSTVAAI